MTRPRQSATPAERLLEDADDGYLTPRERRLAELPGLITYPAEAARSRAASLRRKSRAKK